jgi:hypothetical protein
MPAKITEGLTCMDCQSVFFSIDALVSHILENPGHHNYKWGKTEGVLRIDALLNYDLAAKHWEGK